MSKVLKRRAFTKLGLLIALFVGVAVSILLVTVDGTAVDSWPNWLVVNHWLTTLVRVGLFVVVFVVFYSVRKRAIHNSEQTGSAAKKARLHARVRQLLLWFFIVELLFGQALLPRVLEVFFS